LQVALVEDELMSTTFSWIKNSSVNWGFLLRLQYAYFLFAIS
jgi:hypothetical protein